MELVSENVFLHSGQIQCPWCKTEAICQHNSSLKTEQKNSAKVHWKITEIASRCRRSIAFAFSRKKTRFFYFLSWWGAGVGSGWRWRGFIVMPLRWGISTTLLPCYMTPCYPGSVVLNTFCSGHSPSPGSSPEVLIQLVQGQGVRSRNSLGLGCL